jgi:hypothetical protein
VQRGSITVLPSTDEKVHVSTRKTIVAFSKEEADRIDQMTLPHIKSDEIPMPVLPRVRGLFPAERSRIEEEVARAKAEVARAKTEIARAKAEAEEARKEGEKARAEAERAREEIVRVNVEHPNGAFAVTDMEVRVPPTLPLELSTEHGNIEVRSRQADVKLTAVHGDVTLDDIAGNASAHNARWDQLQSRLLAIDHQSMARIVTALKANHSLRMIGQQIDDLTLTLIAPLGTNDNNIFRHAFV